MQYGSVTSQFGSLDARGFSDEIEKRWQAIEEVREVVSRQVSQGNLSPLDGMKTIAASSAAILGYEEFHPSQGTPTSLTEALLGGVKGRQPVPA